MKLFLLAAAAVIATPLVAQTTPPPADPAGQPSTAQMPTSPNGAVPTSDGHVNAASASSAMQNGTAPMQPQTTGQADMPGSPPMSAATVGGYQPSMPAMSGPMQPGATVTYQQAPSPDQAYPAPAPLAKYPMCKPGQFDQCMQGPGSTHSRQVHRRRK